MQKAQINIKDASACSITLKLKANRDFLEEHQICAGDSEIKTDTCDGDSGGPLIQTFNDIETLIGATSFGPGFCNSDKRPGVYTRVSSFIKWIEDKVQEDFNDLEAKFEINPRVDDTPK